MQRGPRWKEGQAARPGSLGCGAGSPRPLLFCPEGPGVLHPESAVTLQLFPRLEKGSTHPLPGGSENLVGSEREGFRECPLVAPAGPGSRQGRWPCRTAGGEPVEASVVTVPAGDPLVQGPARAPGGGRISTEATQTLQRAGLSRTGWFSGGVFWVIGRKTKRNRLLNELQRLVMFDL